MNMSQPTREELIKAQNNKTESNSLKFQWFNYMVENPYMTQQIAESGNIVPSEFAFAFDALLAMSED